MTALICPSPYSLTRVAFGQAGQEETAYVREHVAGCFTCREELAALTTQGPPEAFDRTLGAAVPLPEVLWKSVSEALQRPPLLLRCHIEGARGAAGGGAREGTSPGGEWLELASGEAELVPLAGGALRGGSPAGGLHPGGLVEGGAARSGATPGGGVAGRLRTGAFEALIRRGPGRLTVVLTRNGEPATARRLQLTTSSPEADSRTESALTDSDGIAVFPRLAGGTYLLEIEGLNL